MVSESVHTSGTAVVAGCQFFILSLFIFVKGWNATLYVSLAFAILAALIFWAVLLIQGVAKLRYKVAPIVTVILLIAGMVVSIVTGVTAVVRTAHPGSSREVLHVVATYAFLSLVIGGLLLLLLFFAPPPRFENIEEELKDARDTLKKGNSTKNSTKNTTKSSERSVASSAE
ncbi:hypothetical protein L596_008620 [Steinernema carpocapsae]|uniref:Uncharacterized protein n=1 Tax=Steinernema carpocapsae TaxID=34508 RepID=A0A4V6A6C3_STECR|nr:hypothetical protein L596_008620 [Steinernema carpocapsae]